MAPFAHSRFHQQQEVHPTSSLVAIDWISSGMFAKGERWQANWISTETKLKFLGTDVPLAWDVTTLDQRSFLRNHCTDNPFGFDLGQHSFNAYASMLIYGAESFPVVTRLFPLAAPFTRLPEPERYYASTDPVDLGTTGRVLLGVNKLLVDMKAPSAGPVYLARWAASSNEDLYQMLNHSLKPLALSFRILSGSDTSDLVIRATSSGLPMAVGPANGHPNGAAAAAAQIASVASSAFPKQADVASTSAARPTASWNSYMLALGALPTGSFAHSSGLEAASQLGVSGE